MRHLAAWASFHSLFSAGKNAFGEDQYIHIIYIKPAPRVRGIRLTSDELMKTAAYPILGSEAVLPQLGSTCHHYMHANAQLHVVILRRFTVLFIIIGLSSKSSQYVYSESTVRQLAFLK